MSDETTTEQLAEIEGQAEDTPATEYTPPEGWRVLAVGEQLQEGDQIVQLHDGKRFPTERAGQYVCETQRYIRRIESESQPQPEPEKLPEGCRNDGGWSNGVNGTEPEPWPEPQPQPESQPEPEEQPQPQPVQVREGRWRTRGGDIRNVTPRPAGDGRKDLFPWWDAAYGGTWTSGGRYYVGEESPLDLDEYLGPIEPQTEPEPEPVPVPDAEEKIRRLQAAIDERAELGGADQTRIELQGRIRELETIRDYQAAAIEELRSEVSYVQRLLGESRQRVTQLEELVTSLRTINDAQEKTVRLAGQENTDLKHRLEVVSDQWAEQADTARKLQIELDAAQRVPQAIADRFEEGWNQGTARAVETIIAWLEPIRLADSAYLANATMQHLPSIMRHLTGLAQD